MVHLMVHLDRYGQPLSTNSSAAAIAYRDGIDSMLSAWPGAAEAFDRAVADDPAARINGDKIVDVGNDEARHRAHSSWSFFG